VAGTGWAGGTDRDGWGARARAAGGVVELGVGAVVEAGEVEAGEVEAGDVEAGDVEAGDVLAVAA
jgi:hypothetical protein